MAPSKTQWALAGPTMGLSLIYGGGGGDKGKGIERSADMSRQAQEVATIAESFLSQLVPGSEEYNEFLAFAQEMVRRSAEGSFSVSQLGGQSLDQQPAVQQYGQQLVSKQQQRIASGGAATPQESRTNLAFQGLRDVAGFAPQEQDVLSALKGQGTATPSGDIFSQLVSRSQNPDQYYKSTLQPQLDLAMDQINRAAAGRGLVRSGAPIEMSQRAAAELAIQEAQQRESFRQNQLANFSELYNVGQGLRDRQMGVEEAMVNLQSGRETNLTQLLANQSQNRFKLSNNVLGLNRLLSEQNLLDEQQSQADLYEALGQAGGAVAGGVASGGNPFAISAGAQAGGALAGGGKKGGQADLLSSLRTQQTPSPLSRQSTGNVDIAALLKMIQSQSGQQKFMV